MTTLKTTLEDLIKAERALEAALVRTLTNAGQYAQAGNTNGAELIERERRNLDKAQEIIRRSKGRLQALAEHSPIVPRGTSMTPADEGFAAEHCICNDGFGMNLSCPKHEHAS